MLLYDLPAGMNPRRVRIFLAEKGITLPVQTVDTTAGEHTKPPFLALNPLGKLPVLQLDDGTVLTESLAICRYLESLHPAPPLFGSTALEQAQVEMWTRRMEWELSRPITDAFMHTGAYFRERITQHPAYGESARAQALLSMAWLDAALAGRDFIAGNRYTIADIVAQCALVLGKATGCRIPAELAHLSRWFAAVSARPTARA